MNEQIATIDLRTRIVDETPSSGTFEFFGSTYTADRLITAERFIAELEAAKAAGARGVVVRIGSNEGGAAVASVKMYRAIREASAGGVRTVAYVEKMAASCAVWVALACDLVVAGPDAKFIVHAAVGPPEHEHEGSKKCNDITREILRARTCTPDPFIEQAVAQRYDPVTNRFNCLSFAGDAALMCGFADAIGDESLGVSLASPACVSSIDDSPRARKLSVPVAPLALTECARITTPVPLPSCSVTGNLIAAHAITADKIAAGQVTADKISVGTLSAISANLGTVTAGEARFDGFTESGGVVTAGAFIGTNPGGPKIRTTADGIQIGAYTWASSAFALTMGSGWSNFGSDAKRMGPLVWIHLSVTAGAGSAWNSIATIPVGYRPNLGSSFDALGVVADSSATTRYPATVRVQTTGVISLLEFDNGSSLVSPFTIGTGDGVYVDMFYFLP